MFRKVLLTIGLLLAVQIAAFAQGTIRGAITDEKNGDPLIGANVVIKQDGQFVRGAKTDYNGNFAMKDVQVGKYQIEVTYVGYVKLETEIDVKASGYTVFNEKLGKAGQQLNKVVVKANRVPVIDIGAPESGTRLSADDIVKMPANSVDGIVAAVAGVGFNDGGSGSARGEGNMVTQVGNVRVRTGVNVPKEAIAEIQVVLGGTPASIGEAIGGTQIITLKPPSTKTMGIMKYETMLDYRLWNHLELFFSGPLFKTALKDENGQATGERTLVGYRLTGTGSFTKFGYYRAKDGRYRVVNFDKVMEIEQKPLKYENGVINYAAEYLRDGDFDPITRPNSKNYFKSDPSREANFASYNVSLQGALDFRFTELSSLVLTAEYDHTYAPSTSLSYFPLNLSTAANGVSRTQNLVLTADFTQRFKDPETPKNESNPDEKVEPTVSKVMYNITAMFNRYKNASFNEKFGSSIDDVFKYGYIGKFDREKIRHYNIENYTVNGVEMTAHVQDSWVERVNSFDASGSYNPILANYTQYLYDTPELRPYLTNFDNIINFNGLVNGRSVPSVYSLFSNVGVQSSGYSKSQTDFYYISAKAAATILGHDLEVGFQYDYYTSSSYSLSAYSLWTLMRNSANAHLINLDFTKANPWFDENGDLYVDFGYNYEEGSATQFDRMLREQLKKNDATITNDTWINIDGISPEDFAKYGGMSMFSSDELFNSGNQYVSYFGYDHTGKKYNVGGGDFDLDNFFTQNEKGYRYLPAFSPIYAAGYIQDKFYFSDLIFNVGVRVDYYDGNQSVLKDPYLLYESYSVHDFLNDYKNVSAGTSSNIPINTGLDNNAFPNTILSSIEDNADNAKKWIVYVDNNYKDASFAPTIRGYRFGSTWYDANGYEVSSPNEIKGETGKPTPYLTRGDNGGYEASTNSVVSKNAFEDYKPQIVPMPRIAFSFPVNEMSQFKANYDIIARRPSSGWQADYLSYLFMTQQNGVINNPNLKPEKITNYELGFQQALNKDKTAAISISAYYKETRDLIQLVQYAGAYPNANYYSYDNLDFKTIKGFSLSFDMRQSNNVRINANYTLQYAEGTGLSSTTMSELIKEGYTTLKMLNPISDDRRHEFKANVDYRLGKGEGWHIVRSVKGSDGTAKKKDVYPFENFGVNFLAVAQSGVPYTKQFSNTQRTIVGSYRGARLPWGFYFNVVVDKTWPIEIKREGKKPQQTMLQAAVTVNNLFDIRNTVGVFEVTGNASDNGYLTDPETQSVINAYLDPQSFRDLYSIYLNNNVWNWSSPRTIRLTLSYRF